MGNIISIDCVIYLYYNNNKLQEANYMLLDFLLATIKKRERN